MGLLTGYWDIGPCKVLFKCPSYIQIEQTQWHTQIYSVLAEQVAPKISRNNDFRNPYRIQMLLPKCLSISGLDATVSIGPSLCSVTDGPHFLSN